MRNPANFSLHFNDFSMNCYGISKSAVEITQGGPSGTIRMCLGFADSPLGF
jgi:hypothetical protein